VGNLRSLLIGYIYDSKTFKLTSKFWYENEEGWGLTEDGKSLIMSDGTSSLTYIDPVSLKAVSSLDVKIGKYPVKNINELEFINGYIYANVWLTDYIIKISPTTGQIVGKIDLSSLHKNALGAYNNADVLNGIAYDSASDQIYVTGKLWPYIFVIKL